MNIPPNNTANSMDQVPISNTPVLTTAQLQQQYQQQKELQARVAQQEQEKRELEASKKDQGFSLIYNIDGDNPVGNLSILSAFENESDKLSEAKEKLNNKLNGNNEKNKKTPTLSEALVNRPQSSPKIEHSNRLSSHGHRISSHGHRLSSHRLSKHKHSRSPHDERKHHHKSHLSMSTTLDDKEKNDERRDKVTKSLYISSHHEHRKSRRSSRIRESERRHSRHHRPRSHNPGNESVSLESSLTANGDNSKSEGDFKVPPRYSSHVNPDNVK